MSASKYLSLSAAALIALTAAPSGAATYPHGISIAPFGGLVVDARGLNGQRLLSHTAASDLNKGTVRGDPDSNDFFIGQQDGYASDLLDQLGGGFASFSVRVTLFDGDNDPGNFDFDDNFLRVNDVIVGNFSEVATTRTNADGTRIGAVQGGLGFGDEVTDTGTFTLTEGTALAALFASLRQSNSLSFEIDKRDDNGNFFDFTSADRIPQSGGGLAPLVASVPLPAGGLLILGALGGLAALRRRIQG